MPFALSLPSLRHQPRQAAAPCATNLLQRALRRYGWTLAPAHPPLNECLQAMPLTERPHQTAAILEDFVRQTIAPIVSDSTPSSAPPPTADQLEIALLFVGSIIEHDPALHRIRTVLGHDEPVRAARLVSRIGRALRDGSIGRSDDLVDRLWLLHTDAHRHLDLHLALAAAQPRFAVAIAMQAICLPAGVSGRQLISDAYPDRLAEQPTAT